MTPRLLTAFLLAVGGVFVPPPLIAQESGTAREMTAVSQGVLESRLKEIEENSGLDDVIKQVLGDKYREALGLLNEAANFRALEAEYREALAKGPAETLRIRSEIEAIRRTGPAGSLPAGLKEPVSNDELERAIAEERTKLATVKTEYDTLTGRLGELQTRPPRIAERRIAAQSELTAALVQLQTAEEAAAADPVSPGNRAEVDRLQALREKLAAEIAMLEQEDLSGEIRETAAEAAHELAQLRIAAIEGEILALRELATSRLSDQVRQAEALVTKIREQSPDPAEALGGLLENLERLITETRVTAGAIDSNGELHRNRETERKRISEAFNNTRRRAELGVVDGTLAKVIMEQLRSLPSRRAGRQRLGAVKSETEKAQRGIFELDRRIRADELEPGAADSARFKTEIESIRDTRDSLRTDLRASYRRWIRDLGEVGLVERQIIAESQAFREYASEKLFWVRSSPAIGWDTFASLPEGIAYCYGIRRVGELRARLAAIPAWIHLLAGIVMAALLLPRRYFRRRLRESGLNTKRISADRYLHTIDALFMTILLAAPVAVAIALAGWVLMRQPDATEWSFGLGLALLAAASYLFHVSFLIVLCRKGGLGEAHFGWDAAALRRFRRLAFWLIPIYLPVSVTMILVLTEPTIFYLDGLGRVTGLVGVTSLGVVGALMMDPKKGVAAFAHRSVPENYFGRLRLVWFCLAIAVPALLAVLFLVGFVFTALLLFQQVEMSLTVIIAAFLLYGMILRWFAIRERKLALEEAVAARNARREAARADASPKMESAQTPIDGDRIPEIREEEVMKLADVGVQMRNLVSFLVGVGLLVGILFIWTKFAPVLDGLDKLKAYGGISVADLAIAMLVIAVTISATRNLPGLLELLILRRVDFDKGTRNSIVTLAKYAVYAIGAMILFRTLGVDWSKLGWIAAALSVGIGFGLQEVVANFISGIILLFERPVRVGDVVTVDGIDGVVSRIQIRATTVTNWDRKELIIPNKNFITGTVLNWTLSNALNRIVIVVGTAYGSDTGKARKILIEVAEDHPRILEDPPPLATFEAFDADSLRLLLRCYVPDMDGRVMVISELHTEIDRRFKEAGIEIAFPQRDLHLRSVEPGIRIGDSPDGDRKK